MKQEYGERERESAVQYKSIVSIDCTMVLAF
jgi:hypothetical protein